MTGLVDNSYAIFVATLIGLSGAAYLGDYARRRFVGRKDADRADFGEVLAASLTLLGLLIGFTFSMAASRYDQRKNYEEAEANAIGTAWLRADLLPDAQAARARDLLRLYLDQRILFYTTREAPRLTQIDAGTAALQANLWSVVRAAAAAQPSPVMALALSGVNDVVNAQGFTQSAWWNRIPLAAWTLMAAVAVCCNLLLGFHARKSGFLLFLISPLIIAIAFFLIADIDSPRGGVIRVMPHNLTSVAQTWATPARP
jgi:F0F1-type ATP synthase membrane subunit c/vacuolar-type H+-ATPase subunit K